MKQKQIIILTLILCALVLGILLKTLAQRKAGEAVSGAQLYGDEVFDFEPGKIEQVLIARGREEPSIVLVKDNGTWKVKSLWNAAADAEKVIDFFEKLRSVRGELRSTGKDLFPDFGISDETAVSVKLLDANNVPALDLRVGTRPSGNGSFVRKAGREEVYLADGNMAELLGIYMPLAEASFSGDYWTDLKPFKIAPEKVRSITVEHVSKGAEKETTLGIERGASGKTLEESPWVFLKSKDSESAIDPGKILRFIAALNSLQAQSVTDPIGKDHGLDKPVLALAVKEEGGREVRVDVGPKNEKEEVFFMKCSDRPEIFKVAAHFFQDLDLKDEQLLKDVVTETASPKVA